MAYYPSTIKDDFSTKVNFTDTVLAAHVNDLQAEVTSIEQSIGSTPTVGAGWVGTFDQVTTSWNSIKDRIQNIEYGVIAAYNNNVSTQGGSTIQSTLATRISLIIKAKSDQSVNLLEFQTSNGTIVTKVDQTGDIYTSGKQLVPIVYAGTQPSGVPAGTVWVDSTSNPSQIDYLAGVPGGGTTGQALVKTSNADYATTWTTVATSAETLTGTTIKNTITGSSLTSVGTITSGTWSGSFGAVSGANLTNLTAGNLSGTIPSAVLGNSTHFIGTTGITLNRTSASQTLTGVSIDGNAATATTATNATLAAEATKFATARNINGVAFDGTANITISTGDTFSAFLLGGM